MRSAIILAAVAGFAAVAAANPVESVATLTGTIQPGGPRQGNNGSNFFNVEGADNGDFASYGVARWDLTEARAALDAEFGAGNWKVTALRLEMTQANAAFSHDGPVDVFYTTDDTTDIKTLDSPLAYPFMEGNTPDLPLGNDGAAICKYQFVVIGTGTVDGYDQAGGPNGPGEALALVQDVADKIASSNAFTLVFVDASTDVAATYRGQIESQEGYKGPKLIITAEQIGGSCYADCDSSGELDIDDFICFQTAFGIGDSYADCDRSGELDIDDFICFQTAFGVGCP